jgi:hypothetical protein
MSVLSDSRSRQLAVDLRNRAILTCAGGVGHKQEPPKKRIRTRDSAHCKASRNRNTYLDECISFEVTIGETILAPLKPVGV